MKLKKQISKKELAEKGNGSMAKKIMVAESFPRSQEFKGELKC